LLLVTLASVITGTLKSVIQTTVGLVANIFNIGVEKFGRLAAALS
jgi:hypothetical protein